MTNLQFPPGEGGTHPLSYGSVRSMICVGLPKRCRGSAVACHVGRRSNCAPGRALPEEPVSGEGLPRPAHAEAPPPGELRHRGRAPSREGHRRWERGGRSWGGLRPTHARAPPPGKGRHRGRVTAAGEGSRCQVCGSGSRGSLARIIKALWTVGGTGYAPTPLWM